MMKKLFALFMFVVAGIVSAQTFPIGSYTAIYALGDSLSDQGNFGTPVASAPCNLKPNPVIYALKRIFVPIPMIPIFAVKPG